MRLYMFRFLEYFTKEDAEDAVNSLDGKLLGGKVVRVLSYHDVSTLDPLPQNRISDFAGLTPSPTVHYRTETEALPCTLPVPSD